MSQTKTILILFSTLSFICLSSCEPSTTYRRIIDNESDKDIWIYTNDTTPGVYLFQDSVLIPAKSDFTYMDITLISSVSEYSDCPTFGSDLSHRIDDNDSLGLTKDLNEEWNYIFEKQLEKKIGGGGECSCTIHIKNSDIE